MNDTGQPLGLIYQVVDKDFYPLGGVDAFRVPPLKLIGPIVEDIKESKHVGKTIRDLGIIVDLDDVGATLWKLSNPCLLDDNDEIVATVLQDVRRDPNSFVEKLKGTWNFSRYFDDERLPDGHLHVLLQLAISGVDGANPL